MKTLFLSIVLLLPVGALAATTTINSSGFTFSPANVTINLGDTINFVLASIHNAQEVDQSTWNANGTTSNGGFVVPFGGGQLILTQTGTYYYVCFNHAFMGMKGIITVNAAPPPSNTITLRSFGDQDGDYNSTGDEVLKNWSLKLYRDSVSSGTLIHGGVNTGSSLTITNLGPGTYVAVEADSSGWSHVTVVLDGIPQGGTPTNQWVLTIPGSNESHTIDFINYAPNMIVNEAFTFFPDSLAIITGDSVHFVLEQMHDAREVSQATWDADDTVSNGGFEVPFGGGTVTLTDVGVHYYVCIVHAAFGMKGRIVVRPVPVVTNVSVPYAAGWNMVSLPVTPSNNTVSALYPTAASNAFSYTGTYVSSATISPGPGYWLKFNDTATANLSGESILGDSLPVAKGWNLIGALTSTLASSSVGSSPSGIISSLIYGYNGSYFASDSLYPGFGYWVKTDQAGSIHVGSNGNVPRASEITRLVAASASSLTVRDAAGHQKSLYLLDAARLSASFAKFRELPPVPPAGVFDVRFGSGAQLEALAGEESKLLPLRFSSAQYPLTISWNVPSGRQPLGLLLDGAATAMSGRGSVIVRDASVSVAVSPANGAGMPAGFAIAQPYPNPCNPSTTISYALPSESQVVLRVFNLLGQSVATLAQGVQDAGVRSVVWNTGANGSGIYFVRLSASPTSGEGKGFSQTVKVLVQK